MAALLELAAVKAGYEHAIKHLSESYHAESERLTTLLEEAKSSSAPGNETELACERAKHHEIIETMRISHQEMMEKMRHDHAVQLDRAKNPPPEKASAIDQETTFDVVSTMGCRSQSPTNENSELKRILQTLKEELNLILGMERTETMPAVGSDCLGEWERIFNFSDQLRILKRGVEEFESLKAQTNQPNELHGVVSADRNATLAETTRLNAVTEARVQELHTQQLDTKSRLQEMTKRLDEKEKDLGRSSAVIQNQHSQLEKLYTLCPDAMKVKLEFHGNKWGAFNDDLLMALATDTIGSVLQRFSRKRSIDIEKLVFESNGKTITDCGRTLRDLGINAWSPIVFRRREALGRKRKHESS